MLGIKQEALALSLGEDWNQKKVSLLEAKEVIEDKLLEEVAKELKVPVEAIRNFDEQAAVNIINNTITNHDNATGHVNYDCTFNPIDKIVELYEEVLKVEREKIALLERILGKSMIN